MKGMYFIGLDKEVYQILSEPLVVADSAGFSEIQVVAVRAKDNCCTIFDALSIGILYTDKSHLPKEYRD